MIYTLNLSTAELWEGMLDKYDELFDSQLDREWELIKPDSCRLTKDEEMAAMRLARKNGWNNLDVSIRKNKVFINEK